MISAKQIVVTLFLTTIHTVRSGAIQDAALQETEHVDNLQDNREINDEGAMRESEITAVVPKFNYDSFQEAFSDIVDDKPSTTVVMTSNTTEGPQGMGTSRTEILEEETTKRADVAIEQEFEGVEVEEDTFPFNFTSVEQTNVESSNHNVTTTNNPTMSIEDIDTKDEEEIARREEIAYKDGFGAILNINFESNVTGTVESDMRVIRKRSDLTHINKWRKAKRGLYRNLVPIPYKLDKKYSRENVRVIRSAMTSFAKHTCVRFVPRRSEIPYIYVGDGIGCSSYVGKTGINRQFVSLNISKCVSKGIATHEFMHVVGFLHEHSRSDRDQYVKILTYNFKKGMKLDDFQKFRNTRNLVNYDYNSVMHYTRTADSKNSKYLPSLQIIPRRKPEPTIGQRDRMSPYDIEEIKYLYECGLGTYQRCGRDFVNKTTGSFSSPSYPSAYPAASHCTWNITVRAGRYVTVTFKKIDISDSPLCENDAVLIHDGTSAASPVLRKICGNFSDDIEITSTGQSMFIIFSSDLIVDRYTGFRAAFRENQKPGKAPKPLTIPPLPRITPLKSNNFRCNFDSGLCGMTQDSLDDLDWLILSGETPSHLTGPSGDHTSEKGKYIYVEYSPIPNVYAKPGDSAIIRTPWLVRRSRHCVSFAYHMYGNNMGGLSLFAYEKRSTDRYGHEILLWQKLGNQGNKWFTARVDYKPGANVQMVQFYWEMHVYHYTSDAALDDISVTARTCSLRGKIPTPPSSFTATKIMRIMRKTTTMQPPPATTNSIPRTTTTATVPTLVDNLNCTFENGLCGWVQSTTDQFNWSFDEDDTPSPSTGPSADHTIGVPGKGKYLFIEASYRQSSSDVARLVSPLLTPTTHCIHMWYHMYGERIGKLKIFQVTDTFRKTLFEKSGNQGNKWLSMSAEINTAVTSTSSGNMNPRESEVRSADVSADLLLDDLAIFNSPAGAFNGSRIRIAIEATVGTGYSGDIAIDDVVITDGSCHSTTVDVAKRKLVSKLTCSFESNSDNLCGMKQLKSDDFNWTKTNGPTPSSGTGPTSDHTKGTESGHYLYIETSGANSLLGLKADLATPKFTPGQYCVRFYAHMFGTDTGSLLVFSKEDFGKGDTLQRTKHWSLSGNQGPYWFQGKFEFASQASTRSVQFIFQGKAGLTFTSDIAIDDISITSGSCRGDVTTHAATSQISRKATTPATKRKTQSTRAGHITIATMKNAPTSSTNFSQTNTKTATITTTASLISATTATATPSMTATITNPSTIVSTTKVTNTTFSKPTAIVNRKTTTTSTIPVSATTSTRTNISITPATTTSVVAASALSMTSRTTTRSDFAVARFLSTSSPTLRKAISTQQPTAKLQLPSVFACDFDKTGFCGMKQSTDVDFNWIRGTKKTPSNKTGPAADHTRGSPGYFMYIETSAPRRFGNKAIISTPSVGVETPKRCVTFWYHMLVSEMGTFEIFVEFSSSQSSRKLNKAIDKREKIFSRSGNQGDQWKMGRVEIAQNTSFYGGSLQIQFVGTRGQTYQGDLSVDDICTAEGPCDQTNRCAPSGVLRQSIIRTTVASKPVTTTVARTTTRRLSTTSTTTIRASNSITTPITITTSASSTTTTAITPTMPTKLALNTSLPVGLRLCNFEGKKQPQNLHRSLSRPSTTNLSLDIGDYKPSVEYSGLPLCGFTQVKSKDQFDWIRRSGSTPSDNTGPRGDHTTSQGYYVYIEASLPQKTDDVALLQTYKMFPTAYCVDLYYHMFGDYMGRLSVRSVQKLSDGRHAVARLKTVVGNQGNSWKKLQVDYRPLPDALTAAFRLEGVIGRKYRSDIAVDDVRIIPGRCDACNRPSHNHMNSLRQQQNFATGCVHPGLFWVRCCSVTHKPVIYRRVKQCNPNMFSPTMLNWLC